MTIPGLVEKSDDKEKLVGDPVATILPKRDRLVKIKKRRHILKFIISLALLLLFMSTVFLTICYVKKIGPFRHSIRVGRYAIGHERFGHKRVYESYEITDEYVLINVPRISIKWGLFHSTKTLHVYGKRLTVIHFDGVCFIRPMLNTEVRHDWLDRASHINTNHRAPNHFKHIHWRMTSHHFPPNFLRESVHEMAGAMCMSRPLINLRPYLHHERRVERCVKKCVDCPQNRQFFKWESVNGEQCQVCHCKEEVKGLRSSTHVDPNCKKISCENKCQGRKMLGCVQCKCADVERQTETNAHQESKNFLKMVFGPEGNKGASNNELPTMVDPVKPMVNKDVGKTDDSSTDLPVFQDLSRIHRNDLSAGDKRQKRSIDSSCKVVAEIFEGVNPVDGDSLASVDYIHNC